MTLSDALPVQFWLIACQTFNQYEAEGVHHVCWCQPWNCGDEIVIQFQETSGGDYLLSVVDENDAVLFEDSFLEIQSGVYQLSFTPEDNAICDELIQLKITNNTSPEEVFAQSDCLDIKSAHTETILIEYSNQRNFAGLIYENDSPDTTFKVRVPCRFFHETEPEEDEAMELTSSVLTTSAQVKTQRLLEVKHVPYYFHKKLRRVLKHQTVTIGSIEWKKEEQYKENEGNKRWPLKSATCLLTEKNSVVRNVL